MLVDDLAVAAKVFIEGDAIVRQPEQLDESALAVLDRLASHVSPLTSSRSNAQRIARLASMTADQVEHRKAVVVTNDRLAVDDARSDGQRVDRSGSQ